MDAALAHRDTRRCARPGCADVAVATLSFRYDLSQAWVMPLTDESSPATYDLCGPCADRTKPPRGWHLVDERPDLDASVSPLDEHDVVRAAIAAALRGQSAPLEVVADETPGPEDTTPPTGVLHAVPDAGPVAVEPAPVAPLLTEAEVAAPAAPSSVEPPAPAPVIDEVGPAERQPVARAPLASRERARRPRPVEVLIQHVPQVAESSTTVAGDDDLVAALREHQDRTHATAGAGPVDVPGGLAEFFAVKEEAATTRPVDVRPVPPAGTMQVPDTKPADLGPGSTAAVLASALEEVVADLPPRPSPVRAANVPLAFDAAPDRLVPLDELGDFDEADLIAGLRDRGPAPDVS